MIDNGILNINKPVSMTSNLSFDHPLSCEELFNLQNLLISSFPLSQVYFKDDVDIQTIEKVKLLMEGVPGVNDSLIEKYIMIDISEEEKQTLLDMNFFNIDTWNVTYNKMNNRYSITSLSKYRTMEEWFREVLSQVDDDNLSLLEKLCYLYDRVKILEFDDNPKYDRLPEIISDTKATPYGYNLIFKELLSRCGIISVIGKISNKGEDDYITLATISDKKYGIEGVYGFNPSMDTIHKNQYKNNFARKMNYNYFCITTNKLKNAYPKRSMQGFLRIIVSDDIMEFNHVSDLYHSKPSTEVDIIEKDMNLSLKEIYLQSNNTKDISNDVFISIITKNLERYPGDIYNKKMLTKVISDNYNARDSELFTNKYVKKMSKIDTIK